VETFDVHLGVFLQGTGDDQKPSKRQTTLHILALQAVNLQVRVQF